MKSILTKVWYAFLCLGSLVVALIFPGFTLTITKLVGIWAYPAFFLVNMGLVALVFEVVWPEGDPDQDTTPKILKRFFRVDGSRFDKGWWPWFRSRGSLVFATFAAVTLGPPFAAVVLRILGSPRRQAWIHATIATAIAIGFWVSVYLGLLDSIRHLWNG